MIKLDPDPPLQQRRGGAKEWGLVSFKSSRDPKIMAGVWEAAPRHVVHPQLDHSELMYVLSGSFTLTDNTNGRREKFTAGDALLVPRGTSYTWDQPAGDVRKFWFVFDAVSEPVSEPPSRTDTAGLSTPTFIRLGAVDTGSRQSRLDRASGARTVFESADARVVYREAAPAESGGSFVTNNPASLIVVLSGSARVIYRSGAAEQLRAGDVVIVPRNLQYKWCSDGERVLYVVFDQR